MKKKTKFYVGLSLIAIALSLSACGKKEVEEEAGNQPNETMYAINDSTSFDGLYKKAKDVTPASTKPGLSDYKSVGVAKTAFENERLYGSESLNVDRTINASDFGANGSDSSSDSLAMKRIIQDCKAHPNEMTKVVFQKGDYDFVEAGDYEHPNMGFCLDGLKNVIFSGNGSTFWFDGEIMGAYAVNCENIYFEDIYVDYGKTPYAVGIMTENSDGETFKVKINPGFNAFDENPNTNIGAWLEYTRYGVLLPFGNDIYGHVKYQSYDKETRILTVKFDRKYNPSPKNTYVVVRYYTYEFNAFHFVGCKNMHLESVTLYTCPGFALGSYSTENLYINRFNIQLKPNCGRLMTCTADAIHTIDTYGEVKVTNCLFENCGDDALNVHGMYWKINKFNGSKGFVANNIKGYNYRAYPGDKLEIVDDESLVVQTVTVKTCAPFETAAGGFVVEIEEDLSSAVKLNYSVGNVTRSPKLVFSNNVVRNKRCRGLLIKTRDVVVSNCTFSYCAAGMILGTDTDDWLESINPINVDIYNCKFMNLNLGNTYCNGDILFAATGKGNVTAAIGAIQDIDIENNYFNNGGTAGVAISSSKGVTVSHNLFNNNGTYAEEIKRVMTNSSIILSNSEDVSLLYNSVHKSSSASYKPIFVGNNIKASNITVTGNNGFTAADLQDKVARIEVGIPTVSTLGMDSSSFADWSSAIDPKYQLEICGSADELLNEIDLDETSFKLNYCYAAVSNDGLYLGYDVFDDSLNFYASESFWSGDGCEIFISSDTESTDALETLKVDSSIDCVEVFTSGDETWGKQLVSYRTTPDIFAQRDQVVIDTFVHADEKGYAAKIFIPFSIISHIQDKLMTQNGKISLCFNFSDRDSVEERIQHATCFNMVEFNKYVPGKMNMVFVEE